MKNEWVTAQGYYKMESCVKQGVVLVNEEEKQDLDDSELFDKYVVKVQEVPHPKTSILEDLG